MLTSRRRAAARAARGRRENHGENGRASAAGLHEKRNKAQPRCRSLTQHRQPSRPRALRRLRHRPHQPSGRSRHRFSRCQPDYRVGDAAFAGQYNRGPDRLLAPSRPRRSCRTGSRERRPWSVRRSRRGRGCPTRPLRGTVRTVSGASRGISEPHATSSISPSNLGGHPSVRPGVSAAHRNFGDRRTTTCSTSPHGRVRRRAANRRCTYARPAAFDAHEIRVRAGPTASPSSRTSTGPPKWRLSTERAVRCPSEAAGKCPAAGLS